MKSLAVLLILTGSCFARPGETAEQLQARYGYGGLFSDYLPTQQLEYRFEARTITATFVGKICVREELTGGEYPETTVIEILKAVSDGKQWSLPQDKGEFRVRTLGRLVARYNFLSLTIELDDAQKQIDAKKTKASEPAKPLKGF